MTELKAVGEGTFRYVQKQFDESTGDRALQLTEALQVVPAAQLLEEFEAARTRVETALRARGEKLVTRQLWAAPPDEHYDGVLQAGFFGAFRGGPCAFFADPARALGTLAPPRHLLLCRVALGVAGSDYTETAGAVVVHSHTAVPAFSCTWRRKSVAVAVSPQQQQQQEQQQRVCSACGKVSEAPNARFCMGCGAAL